MNGFSPDGIGVSGECLAGFATWLGQHSATAWDMLPERFTIIRGEAEPVCRQCLICRRRIRTGTGVRPTIV